MYLFSHFVSPWTTEIELDFDLCAVLAHVWHKISAQKYFGEPIESLKKPISYLQTISRDDTNKLVYFFLFVKK